MLSDKITNITPSYTVGISSKVKELKSKGINIVDLSIGEPDFFTPNPAKLQAIESIVENKTKYDLVPGLVDLRKAIQNKLLLENEVAYDINEIVVSSGAKHAITNSLIALLDFGDEVIIPKPYWVSYPEMVKLVGGTPIFVDTQKQNDFKVTVEEIKSVISPKTKMIFISNPSNPTGAIYSKEELVAIVKLCLQHNIYILADEIYEKISYSNHTSIASISKEAKEITITVNGLSKSASMTGWRIGYTATSLSLAKAISTVQGHLVSHPGTISQWAAVSALNDCQEDMNKMVNTYKIRRDMAEEELNKIKGISFIRPEGAFYFFIDVSVLKNNLSWKDSFSVTFCDEFLKDQSVAVVPGVAFGMDDYIRISYACDTESLIEGIKKLKRFVEK